MVVMVLIKPIAYEHMPGHHDENRLDADFI